MKQFTRIKSATHPPQPASLTYKDNTYFPIFWHTTIDQDRPIGSKKTLTEHTHDFYHLVLYTKGLAQYSIEGRFSNATPGTCVLVHPNQKHDFVTKRQNCTYSEITFSYETKNNNKLKLPFKQILTLYSATKIDLPNPLILTPQQTKTLQNTLTQITDYLNSHQQISTYHAHNLLTSIFDTLIKNRLTIKSTPISNNLIKTKTYIEQNYTETITMEDLTKIACLSKGYLFRAFKKAFGTSPIKYQQDLRLEAAKTLLRATSLNCKQIANRTGFKDVYFFHRIFKKNIGKTPKKFRKQT